MKYPTFPLRPGLRSLAGALIGTFLAGCTAESVPADDYPDEALQTVTSDSGELAMEVRTAPQQPPGRGTTDVELTIRDIEGELRDDLSLQVTPWMPDMGHGASTKPASQNMGDGRYEVLGVAMFMSGRWELRLDITGAVEDSATVAFQIP